MLFPLICLVGFALINAQNDLSAVTKKGEVIGHYNEAGIREWKGIPFAQPPQGALRWQDPLEPAPFSSP